MDRERAILDDTRTINNSPWYELDLRGTSMKCGMSIFLSAINPGYVRVGVNDYRNRGGFHAYVADRNCAELIQSHAPVGVVIDALLEVHESQWDQDYGLANIAEAIAALESVSLMDIVEKV